MRTHELSVTTPGTSTAPPSRRRPPSWLWVPLTIFLTARLLSAGLLAWASRSQPSTGTLARAADPLRGYFVFRPTPDSPGYSGMLANWDGQWYRRIAEAGYPDVPPDGSAADGWTWAFPPGYPLLVRAVMRLTGLGFEATVTVLGVVLGGAAMVLLYRLLAPSAGGWLAGVAVAATSCFVSAPLLQVAYSEGLALLLVVGVLTLVRDERYALASVLVLALGMTRIVTLPLLVVVAVHVWSRWRAGRRWRPTQLAGIGVLAAACVVGMVLWSLVASLLEPDATGAHRAGRQASGFSYGLAGFFYRANPLAVLLLVALLVLVARVLGGTFAGRVPSEVRTWGWAYLGFLVLVVPPTPGYLRYLLLAFPLGLPLAGPDERPSRARVALVAVALLGLLVLQAWWVRDLYTVGETSLLP